ncbi:30S ribosomal protein S3 [bacterium]|nr:30S ribosomal protein S3 [bacterium]
MGQKVNPIGFRTGVYRDWNARWFARNSYGDMLLEDLKIRRYLDDVLKHAEISRVEIEKAGDNVKVIIHSARPGTVIGKKGQEIDSLRRGISKIIKKNSIEVTVQEIKNPDLDALLVAKSIAEQLEKRVSYKRAMKRSVASTMRAGAKGIKICCAGRLNGAEIARSEWARVGSVPLHTLRADIDYGLALAKTTYGIIGVKVWIGRGDYQLA